MADLKDNFAPEEISRLAMDVGFNEECVAYYHNGIFNFGISTNVMDFKAPLYTQLIDWIYDKYSIDAFVTVEGNADSKYWRMNYTDTSITMKSYNSNSMIFVGDDLGCRDTKADALNHLLKHILKYFIANQILTEKIKNEQ